MNGWLIGLGRAAALIFAAALVAAAATANVLFGAVVAVSLWGAYRSRASRVTRHAPTADPDQRSDHS